MANNYHFDERHRLLICLSCETAIPPGFKSQDRHLRKKNEHHGILGDELKTLLEVFAGYGDIRPLDEPYVVNPVPPPRIPHLFVHRLYQCSLCTNVDITRVRSKIEKHIGAAHGIAKKDLQTPAHWRQFPGQTLYAEKSWINYFEVAGATPTEDEDPETLEPEVAGFFQQLRTRREEDRQRTLHVHGSIDGFEAHKSEVVPWLQRTGIASHLEGLPRDRIKASYELNQTSDHVLMAVIEANDMVVERALKSIQMNGHGEMTFPISMKMCQYKETLEGKSSMFLAHKRQSTLTSYSRSWKQFLTYYFQVTAELGDADFWFPTYDIPPGTYPPAPQLSLEEVGALGDIQEVIAMCGSDTASDIAKLLPTLYHGMIAAKTGPNPFDTALVSFAAMLAMKAKTGTWQEPGDFNHHLSGLIWMSQLLLFDFCVQQSVATEVEGPRRSMRQQPREISTYEMVCKVFPTAARQDSETALGQLLGWRDLLFSVSMSTMRMREAIWSLDYKQLTFGDTRLTLENVTTTIENEFRLARDAMNRNLLLGIKNLVPMRAKMFQDNLNHQVVGESMMDLCKDAAPKNALEEGISKSPHLRRVYIRKSRNGSVLWNDNAIDQYEAEVQKFLQHLLAIIHLSSGQPLRSPEILSTKWRNTQNQTRSIWVLHGKVMIRINYHKGLAHTGKGKDNIRFLPPSVGELLLDFLVYVMPLREEFMKQIQPGQKPSSFLWHNGSEVWQDEQVSHVLSRACARASTPRLRVANWRQMTVAIVKHKFAAELHCFDVDMGDDADDANPDVQAMNMQRNHTTATANISYANQHSVGGIIDAALQTSFRASMLWDQLFKVEDTLEKLKKRLNPAADAGASDDEYSTSKKIRVQTIRKRWQYKPSELLKIARQVFDNPAMQWRSVEQGLAMTMVMSPAEVVVAILPTGCGKSLLFMLPCKLHDAGVTILILPLVSLRADMQRRLDELNIHHMTWRAGTNCLSHATIVIVSVESAATAEFVAYGYHLLASHKLDRIVVDECHLTVTTNEYRDSMMKLPRIRVLPTQFLYLTATLPPSMEANFKRHNYLAAAKIVRACSDRRKLMYRIRYCKRAVFLEEAAAWVKQDYHHMCTTRLSNKQTGKIMVYCQTIAEAEEMGRVMDCAVYTSSSGTPEDKLAIVNGWIGNAECPYIVATSALAAGFDYPHVRHVWHIGAPRSMVDYVQEAGRAGRDGCTACCTVVLPKGWLPNPDLVGIDGSIDKLLSNPQCMRLTLSKFMDGDRCPALPCDQGAPHLCGKCKDRASGKTVIVEALPIPEGLPSPTLPARFTGLEQIQLEAKENEELMTAFLQSVQALKSGCLVCLMFSGSGGDGHATESCPRGNQQQFFAAKTLRLSDKRNQWMEKYTACFNCYFPQTICRKATERIKTPCEFPDMLLLFCWILWQMDPTIITDEAGPSVRVDVRDDQAVLNWLGKRVKWAGIKCIQAVPLAARYMSQFNRGIS